MIKRVKKVKKFCLCIVWFLIFTLGADGFKTGRVQAESTGKNITYTVNLTLPDVSREDVHFTVYAKVDGKIYSKRGVVYAGEKNAVLNINCLPAGLEYTTEIHFDCDEYRNAELEHVSYPKSQYANDFKTDFTVEYLRKVECDVSLPDGFNADGNIEVKVSLSKYQKKYFGSFVNNLDERNDSVIITLNNENRSEKICLYSQSSSAQLSYEILTETDGLCTKGYLRSKNKFYSYDGFLYEIESDMEVDFSLLRREKVLVRVVRPYSISVDNDIFAKVVISNMLSDVVPDTIIDFTETALIPTGERIAEFEIDVNENEPCTLKIVDIAGDDSLFDCCCYVYNLESPADETKLKYICYSDECVELNLLVCNNISGSVECEKMDLNFVVEAICNQYIGNDLKIVSAVRNGKFRLKIPEDVDDYTLLVHTDIGVNSYYISDGISTNDVEEATKNYFEYESDKAVTLKYIIQNRALPLEISYEQRSECFKVKNISDNSVKKMDIYVAYYDAFGKLISVDKTGEYELMSNASFTLSKNTRDYRIKKVKAFIWKQDSTVPLADTTEMEVNIPYMPENDLTVFKTGDNQAIIYGKKEVVSKAPELINSVMYIPATYFEKLGYEVDCRIDTLRIKNDKWDFEFEADEYAAFDKNERTYVEMAAPVLCVDEFIVPLVSVCELFEEDVTWFADEQTAILNLPFEDVLNFGEHSEAIFYMYYRGVVAGYEDGMFRPDKNLLRSEAAAHISRALEHACPDFEFECSDVSSNHWAKGFIGMCIDENIFELENDKFRPNDYITLEESVSAALNMKGIKYDNCMETAKENGLLEYIDDEDFKRNITRSELAQLLYNSLV